MSLPGNVNIGDWTPAQLQAFIQGVMVTDRSMLPSGMNLNQSIIQDLVVGGELDYETAVLKSEGVPLKTNQFVMAQRGSLAKAAYENLVGGDYRSSADPKNEGTGVGDYIAWAFDPINLVNLTDWGTNLGSAVLKMRAIDVPFSCTIYDLWIHIWTAGAYTPNNYNGGGLYLYDFNSDTANLIASSANTSALTYRATHSNGCNLTVGPIFIQPGPYYVATLVNWSAQTVQPVIGAHGTGAGVRISNNHVPRAVSFPGQTTLPTSITGANLRANESRVGIWTGIS